MATATSTPSINWRLARKYISYYKNYLCFEDAEPTVVAWYETSMRYGGCEEGGWYYEQGWPIKQICVFSKKQAIREAIKLEAEATEAFGPQRDNLGWDAWSVTFSNGYAKPYPQERPYYC